MRRSFDTGRYQLLSAVRGELVVSATKKITRGRRSFRYAGPSLRNALSQDIDFSLFTSPLQTKLERSPTAMLPSLTAQASS